jgi:hypothetical protein
MSLIQKCSYMLCIALLHACGPVNNAHTPTATVEVNNRSLSDHEIRFRNDIPMRAVREVMSRFDVVENVSWEKTPSGWLATCVTKDSINKIYFTEAGDWTVVRSNYTRAPRSILDMINQTFGGYHVRNVYSLVLPTDSKNRMYSVLINKAENNKLLKLYKGEMTVFCDFIDATTHE